MLTSPVWGDGRGPQGHATPSTASPGPDTRRPGRGHGPGRKAGAGPSCCLRLFVAIRMARTREGTVRVSGRVGTLSGAALGGERSCHPSPFFVGKVGRSFSEKGQPFRELAVAWPRNSSGTTFLVLTTDRGELHYGLALAWGPVSGKCWSSASREEFAKKEQRGRLTAGLAPLGESSVDHTAWPGRHGAVAPVLSFLQCRGSQGDTQGKVRSSCCPRWQVLEVRLLTSPAGPPILLCSQSWERPAKSALGALGTSAWWWG